MSNVDVNFIFSKIIISGIISLIISFLIIRKNQYFKFINRSELRINNNNEILRFGGLAIFISFFTTFFIFINYGELANQLENFSNKNILLFSSFLFFIIGFLDDIIALPPIPRLLGQILISVFTWLGGLKLFAYQLPIFGQFLEGLSISPIISLLITTIWIVGITNAYNWIDGLDGLAAGISVFSLFGFLFLGLSAENFFIVLVSSILLGSSFGFIYHNFYPAKIYMGDSGSYFLGSIISLLAITLMNDKSNEVSLLSPLIILSIPILDMIFVIFKRIWESRSPFYPDRSHLHHKLIDLGLSHRKSVLFIYTLNAIIILLFLIISNF